jgi:N-methylhydantoinase A
LDTAIFDYDRLAPGALLAGPSIIESPLTTIVVPPSYEAAVDGYRNVVITRKEDRNGHIASRPA